MMALKLALTPGRRHLGISRPRARPHLFGGDVLGRLRPARAHRRAPFADRPRRAMARLGRKPEARRFSPAPGTKSSARSAAASTAMSSTPACCCCTSLASWPPTIPRFVSTVEQIGLRLARNGMLLRYDAPDDFGAPTVSFAVCTFWYVDALAAVGRVEEAREMFEKLLARAIHAGLLSEDIDPATGELWGNFPADLFAGRHHHLGHAAVARLGERALKLPFGAWLRHPRVRRWNASFLRMAKKSDRRPQSRRRHRRHRRDDAGRLRRGRPLVGARHRAEIEPGVPLDPRQRRARA